jgi:hypothetical protein
LVEHPEDEEPSCFLRSGLLLGAVTGSLRAGVVGGAVHPDVGRHGLGVVVFLIFGGMRSIILYIRWYIENFRIIPLFGSIRRNRSVK